MAARVRLHARPVRRRSRLPLSHRPVDRDEALDLLRVLEPTKAARVAELERDGYPAYLTSAGWLGYPEPKVRALSRKRSLADGWRCFKTKVGVTWRPTCGAAK